MDLEGGATLKITEKSPNREILSCFGHQKANKLSV